MSETPMPSAAEIFRRPVELEPEDEVTFPQTEQVDNPLAIPLTSTLQALQRSQDREQRHKVVVKQALEVIHDQQLEIQQLRRQIEAARKATT